MRLAPRLLNRYLQELSQAARQRVGLMSLKRVSRLVRKTFAAWTEENALEWGAALASYTAFSIAPLLIIALSAVGLVYKGDTLAYVHREIASLIGENAAKVITAAIQSMRTSDYGSLANVISIAALCIGATSVFVQLQTTLNRIWGVKPKPDHFWRDLLKQRVISFAMILGISFLLLVSLLVSAFIAAITAYFSYLLPGVDFFWQFLDAATSFSIVIVLFAAIYRIVPDVQIEWRDVWAGAILTAVLFVAGRFAIGFYLGRSGIASAYGAAGSILILLAWVYYSSQVLFFGAIFTKFYAEENRRMLKPISGAAAVTKEAKQRARGIKPDREKRKAG
jgi:membrane protein